MKRSFCRCARLLLPIILLGQSVMGSTEKPVDAGRKFSKEPVRIIYDTDIGNDVDDVLALGLLHALQNRNECELLAVTVTKSNEYAPRFVDVVNTFYGRGDIPIGRVYGGATPDDGLFNKILVTAKDDGRLRYPHDLKEGNKVPEAAQLLRKILSQQPDRSVVIVQVGFSTNLAHLLDSEPDSYSALTGSELVKKKVRFLSIMAGRYDQPARQPEGEYNIVNDIDSARKLFDAWPTPIIASGWEVGMKVRYPSGSIERDYRYTRHHPLAEAYKLYVEMPHNRPCWDLTSVLYAVRPNRDYFNLSAPGKIAVDENGITEFKQDPKGNHRLLTVNRQQIIRLEQLFADICSEPPKSEQY